MHLTRCNFGRFKYFFLKFLWLKVGTFRKKMRGCRSLQTYFSRSYEFLKKNGTILLTTTFGWKSWVTKFWICMFSVHYIKISPKRKFFGKFQTEILIRKKKVQLLISTSTPRATHAEGAFQHARVLSMLPFSKMYFCYTYLMHIRLLCCLLMNKTFTVEKQDAIFIKCA